MIPRLRFIVDLVRDRLARWPALKLNGLLGVGLGAMCGIIAVFRGPEIPPEGNLIDTASFDGALGVFTLTLAVMATGVSWARWSRRVWVGTVVAVTLYAYGIETIQAFRGLDPRFSSVAGPIDEAAGGIFGGTAIIVAICFTILAFKYFRARTTPLVAAVRYGATTAWLAFGVGIAMSAANGRFVPENGNLLFVHAVGFHGLQAVPLVALMLHWANATDDLARPLVHVAGLAWLGLCVALVWQSASGRALGELSIASLLVVVCLLIFSTVLVVAGRAWSRTMEPVAAS